MTVARDALLESATFTTTTPHTFVFTPVGTPKAIIVGIGHGTVSTDLINGAVTYGGVAMTRIPTNGLAQDAVGEPGAAYLYFLGASIPTGAQTVSISHTGSADVKWAICASYTAGADTEVTVSGKLEGDAANPSIALDTSATESIRAAILYSGQNQLANLAVLAGMEAIAAANGHDFGNFVALLGQETTASTGSFTIGYTATTEDVAMCAVAIQEVSGGTPATVTPDAIAITITLPTPVILAESTVTPAQIDIPVTLPTPVILAESTVTPAQIDVAVTLPTPVPLGEALVTAEAIAVPVTLPTPTVIAGGGAATVTPSQIDVTVTLPTPTVLGEATVTPDVVAVPVTLPSPTPLSGATVSPEPVAITISLPTPVAKGAALVVAGVIDILVTLPTPTIVTGVITALRRLEGALRVAGQTGRLTLTRQEGNIQ